MNKNSNKKNKMRRITGYQTSSRLVLLASLFPVGGLAWNTPGEDFSTELTLGGAVTNSRNPWVWKIMPGITEIKLSVTESQTGKRKMEWRGLLESQAVLLGKTILDIPSGRSGLAPKVRYSTSEQNYATFWQGDGVVQITLPVYDTAVPTVSVGQLSFQLYTTMVLRYSRNGHPEYASVYSDLDDNGLPPQGKSMTPGRIPSLLCQWFTGERPVWLCAVDNTVVGEVPLSGLMDSSVRHIQAIYGAGMVDRSGILTLRSAELPVRWGATLSVRIDYQ